MKYIFALFFAFAVMILPSQLSAQNKKTLVSVPVAVSDKEGRYVSGLKKEDFMVMQNGVQHEIVSFDVEDEPINVGILIDTSRSTDKVISKIKDAAKDFISALSPKDKGMVATFGSDVATLSQFTSDHKQLEAAIDKITASEKVGSVLRRSINQIVQHQFSKVSGRKALIILSDGKDFGSFLTKEELLDSLQESDVMIYPIFYKTGMEFSKILTPNENPENKTPKPKQKKKKKGFSLDIPDGDFPSEDDVRLREKREDLEAMDSLKKIADITAGRFYERDTANLKGTFDQIADELRKQYRLSYYSTQTAIARNTATANLLIKVNRPDTAVRVREGVVLKN